MEAHALLLPFQKVGHINPFLQLARRLISVGFSLTILSSQQFHELLEQSWQPCNPKIRLLSLPELGVDHSVQFIISPQLQLKQAVQLLVEKIEPKLSCIISDPLYNWAPDLAQELGISSAVFFTASVVSNVIDGAIPRLLQECLIPVKNIARSRASAPLIHGIPGLLTPINAFDLPCALQKAFAADPDYKNKIKRYNMMKKASWVLANTFEELEADALQASRLKFPNFIPVGPLLKSKEEHDLPLVSEWEVDRTCLKLSSSVLYISFGSMANLEQEQILQLAYGLESSKQPFLWAFRTDLVAGSSKGLLDEFLSRIKGRGLVIDWAPQVEVLQHPSVGGFLTHCGWNSILEGICAGVPMLGLPCWAEQPINCRFVADIWKIGLRLCDNDIVESTEVAEKIRKLMVHEEGLQMKRRVQQLARSALSGSSYKNLHVFADAMSK